MNDTAPYLSAVAALIGTFVGGITSIATSWLGQQRQTKEQRKAQEKDELQALYGQFIQDASRLYLDALEHDTTELSKLVDIYTTINRMRLVSSANVVAEADCALVRSSQLCQRERDILWTRQPIAHGSLIRCAPSARRAAKS